MRISKFAIAMIPVLVASSIQAAPIQLLTNRGFENANPSGSHMLGWTVNGATTPPNPGPIQIKEYPSSFWSPGAVPDGNGPWGVEMVQNAGASFVQNNVQQTVAVAPGLYEVSASVWARIWDNVAGFSRARFELRADGATVQQIDLVNDASGDWTPWTQLQTATHVIPVTTSLGVFLQMRANGTGGANSWGQVVADSFRLDAELLTPPTVIDAEYDNINSYVPGSLVHQFLATDDNTPLGPFLWDQLQLVSYTPNYGGSGPGPAVDPTLSSTGEFEWNTIGSPRGDYVWSVRATDPHNLTNTGTITVRVTAVPEPSTVAVIGLTLLCGFVLRMRRR